MKLNNCIELAKASGLETLGEAYDNVSFHATQMFLYEQIAAELNELVTSPFTGGKKCFCEIPPTVLR